MLCWPHPLYIKLATYFLIFLYCRCSEDARQESSGQSGRPRVTKEGESSTFDFVFGHWSLVIGHWSLVIGHWSLSGRPRVTKEGESSTFGFMSTCSDSLSTNLDWLCQVCSDGHTCVPSYLIFSCWTSLTFSNCSWCSKMLYAS